jgi:hypothetical protein
MATEIALVEDGPGSYRFTFISTRGELSGRVKVGIQGPPDRQSYQTESRQQRIRFWLCRESSQQHAETDPLCHAKEKLLHQSGKAARFWS